MDADNLLCGYRSAPVRTTSYCVHEMRADGDDTEWTMCLEFNAGGSLPTRLVDGFLYGQSKLFAHMSSE